MVWPISVGVLGLSVCVRGDRQPRPMTGEVSQVVFRVVQQALTNAARHAQHAQVQVGLVYEVNILDVQVSDSGPGQSGEPAVP